MIVSKKHECRWISILIVASFKSTTTAFVPQHLDKQKCFKHTKWKFNFVKSEHNKNKIIFFMYSIKIQLSRHQKAFFHSTLALTALSINKLHITLCYTALCASEFCMNTSHFATGWKLLLFLHEICIYPSSFVINFCKICMPSAFVCLLPCRKMCAGVGNRFPSLKVYNLRKFSFFLAAPF